MDFEGWSLEEDLKLVNGILHCGYGNWTDIAARLNNKSPEECMNRYLDKFIVNPDNDELKEAVAHLQELRCKPSLCASNCNLSVDPNQVTVQSAVDFLGVEQYIRDLCNDSNNENVDTNKSSKSDFINDSKLAYQHRSKLLMANGINFNCYNPFRNEFDMEYDDKAETVLETLWEPPDSFSFSASEDNLLFDKLKYALADSYNFRLAERINRKKIIRSHGLVDGRKTYNMTQRFDVPFGTSCLSKLLAFLKFMEGPVLDFLVERLYYQNEVRYKLNSLLMYRSLGIRFLNGIHIYEKLNKKRLKYKKEIGHIGPLPIETQEPKHMRRPSAPLTLHNLPGYHLLDDDEKILCSTARIVPVTYFNFKKLLISECNKREGLKLAQARHLLKIDVNKTRKVYDHLMSTGDIWPIREMNNK
ncbi:transcriptional adapter 2A [Rhodnius prolixus]|uniref:transcriptional adapter 2A n=1 Tax=Rhodnius prolixus TaxID=13249 RepID=UPI003D18E759